MSRKNLYLGLAFHNHQPVGNDPSVFAWAYQRSYLPLVEILEKHSSIRVSLHYSGPLLDWLLANRPDFLDRLAALASTSQVEMMGGGYYEPILPAIPPADRTGQIEKMSAFCTGHFGQRPTGIWLAERVWEPDLPATLAQAGAQWTVVDDTHFRMIGLEDKDLFGYYITEDQGKTLKIFPTSKYLRYAIPWHEVPRVMDYLWEVATVGVNLAVLGDDGEKFGLWPGTYAHCWEKGWVEEFFHSLERNQDWLHTIPLGEYATAHPPLGRVYLPTASYDEMMEWALPAERSYQVTQLRHRLQEEGRDDILRFLGGGFWRHFLVKYPEVNNMHKKMLRVHRQVWGAVGAPLGGRPPEPRVEEPAPEPAPGSWGSWGRESSNPTGYEAPGSDTSRGDTAHLDKSDTAHLNVPYDRPGIDELWKGQCNCPYWHGVFGGIYLGGIRAETYSHLIEAQNQVDAATGRPGPHLGWEMQDLDCDGREELLIEGSTFNLYLAPAVGGSLFEWDLRHPPFNLASTLSSRREAYHQELLVSPEEVVSEDGEVQTIHAGLKVKEPGLAKKIHFDSYRRVSLIDHFLRPDVDLSSLKAARHQEVGDFTTGPYQALVTNVAGGLRVALARDGQLHYEQAPEPFRVEKELEMVAGQPRFTILYRLTNTAPGVAAGLFASEWSLHLLGGGGDPQGYWEAGARHGRLDATTQLQDVEHLALGNRRLGIHLSLRANPRVALWQYPLEAVSNSEGGLERTFQGTCFMVLVPFELRGGESLSFTLQWAQG